MSEEQPYLEMTDPANGEVVAHVYASRIVFVRAADYELLLQMKGSYRVPEGVSFRLDGDTSLAAAKAVKTAPKDERHTKQDPRWLAAMRIAKPRQCDSCGSPEGRYDAGRPGHYTTCRDCATAGVCMTCGQPLTEGKCAGELVLRHSVPHSQPVLAKTSTYRGGAANQETVRHVRYQHPVLAAHLEAEPDVHDPTRPVGRLEEFSQTYLSDMHEAAHEH